MSDRTLTVHTLPSVGVCEKGRGLDEKRDCPDIKNSLLLCLTLQQQISGARQHRYPDTKMKEFERKVEELEKEYKRYAGISQWRQVFLLSHSGSEDRSPSY